MNLVLVLLKPDQPPTASTHGQTRQQAPQHYPHDGRLPSAAAGSDSDTSSGAEDEEESQPEMTAPRDMPEVSSEGGEQTEHFDGEECQGEDVSGGGEPGG